MKNILIVSYIFPPNTTVVSSFRPYSWYLEFDKYGLNPIAVTRHWTNEPIKSSEELGQETDLPVKVVEEGTKKIYYLPYKNNFFERQLRKHNDNPLSKFWELAGFLNGSFTREADLHFSFLKEIRSIIRKENPQLIILTALPLSAAKLGYQLKKEFNLPVVVDFRDYLNNNLLNEQFPFSRQARFSFFIQERYIRKWLRPIDAVISVSQPILDKLAKLTTARPILIHNGFEKDLFKSVTPIHREKFTVSQIGMLYATQHIDFLVEGFASFLKRAGYPDDCSIELIGQDYLPEISEKFKAALPAKNLRTTPRISRGEALALMKSSHVLFYSGWKGWKGIYSGKIFEYLAAKKNILIAPGDDDVIDELIKETNSGKIANTVDDCAQALLGWYQEWKLTGELSYHGIDAKIDNYSREALAEKLATEMVAMTNKDGR